MPPAWLTPRTAYLHVPFCGHKCGYCDFAVTAGQDHLIELYLDSVALEIERIQPGPVETVFLGGGTPTYLTADQLDRLLTALPFDRRGITEFSIESTPESLDAEKTAVLKRHGVTRVSIGVQSFRPHLLKSLDRRHGVEQIPRAAEAVRDQNLELSFDLIFAAPGQTLDDWRSDLAAALEYGPDHVSTYGLTYEKGTPLWKDRQRGHVVPATDELELAMYETSIDTLTGAGFEHYEVSNFARPCKRCRHNERYWANEAYYGFGPGAAAYANGVRTMNVRDTAQYVKRVLSGESPVFQSEELPPRERAVETLAVQLRRVDGIDRVAFENQTRFAVDSLCGDAVAGYVAEGLLADDGRIIRLTRRGFCVADGIVEALLRASSRNADRGMRS